MSFREKVAEAMHLDETGDCEFGDCRICLERAELLIHVVIQELRVLSSGLMLLPERKAVEGREPAGNGTLGSWLEEMEKVL